MFLFSLIVPRYSSQFVYFFYNKKITVFLKLQLNPLAIYIIIDLPKMQQKHFYFALSYLKSRA